jgi:hypothetical protein
MGGRAGRAIVLLAFAWAACAPVLAVFHHEDGRCCRSGVCCHYREPSDRDCLRSACRCSGHEPASVFLASGDVGVLPAVVTTLGPPSAEPFDTRPDARRPLWHATPPDPPPLTVARSL